MKDLYIVANWKANKTEKEAIAWLEEFKKRLSEFKTYYFDSKKIIICPPFPAIAAAGNYIKKNNLPIFIGSQDVSEFEEGAYTGEVPASLLSGIVKFSLIGHSERRQNFAETDEVLTIKVKNALNSLIMPIFCVQEENTFIPDGIEVVAYEPIGAVGTGFADTPENAERVAKIIKEKNKNIKDVLYGGSVSAKNIASFIKMPLVNGVLVGGASLDPQDFLTILDNLK